MGSHLAIISVLILCNLHFFAHVKFRYSAVNVVIYFYLGECDTTSCAFCMGTLNSTWSIAVLVLIIVIPVAIIAMVIFIIQRKTLKKEMQVLKGEPAKVW